MGLVKRDLFQAIEHLFPIQHPAFKHFLDDQSSSQSHTHKVTHLQEESSGNFQKTFRLEKSENQSFTEKPSRNNPVKHTYGGGSLRSGT